MWNVGSPHILDSYNKTDIPENLYVWLEVWDNLFDYKNNHYYYRFEPTNFRTVLKQIIVDLNIANEQEKPINKIIKQLKEKFDYAISIDFVSKDVFSQEIKKYEELLRKGYNKDAEGLANAIIILSNYILNKFNDSIYFNHLFEVFFEKIFTGNSSNIKELQLLSHFLIIELISKGFSIETVKNIPNNLFSINHSSYLKENNKDKYFSTDLDFTLEMIMHLSKKDSPSLSLYIMPLNLNVIFYYWF